MGNIQGAGGTTTSFGNTPQAKDDSYSYIEDYLLSRADLYDKDREVLTLDVMLNDLGGNAKTLFSIDDGCGNQITDLSQTDLLTNKSYSDWQTTALGNQIRIYNGKIEYRLAPTSPGSPPRDVNTLAQGEVIADSFTYAIRLGNGTLSWAKVSLTLTGSNDGPVANADVAFITENQLLTVDVLANDTDADSGAILTVTSAIAPVGKGTASVVSNLVKFDPGTAFDHLAVGATEQVVINYTIKDQFGATSASTLTITVTGTNDAPVANVDTASATEDGAVVLGSVATNDSDVDDGASLTYTLDAPVAGLTLNADGSYSFDPSNAAYQHLAAGAQQIVVASYTVSDGSLSDSSTLTITVTGTNDAPVANVDSYSTSEDTSITFDVRTNDTDADDGANLSVTRINGTAISVGGTVAITGGSITLGADGKLTYAPTANFSGTPTFAYTVADQHGVTSTATVNLNVSAVNDAPVNTLPATFATDEDVAFKLAGISVSDDSGTGTITVILSVASGTLTATTASGVTVTGSGTSSIVLSGAVASINSYLGNAATQPTYTPVANANGAVTLTMITDDGGNTGGGALTDTDTATINIAPVNDSAIDLTFSYTGSPGNSLPSGAFGQITATDPDGGGATAFSMFSLSATTLSGGAAANFAGDLTVSASGVISASNLDDNRIYSATVRITQDGNTFDETFKIITGTNAGDSLSGVTGDDVIFAQGQGDVILAGSGNDHLFGQQGNDQLNGEAGTDILDGAGGDDTLIGGAGNDRMTGGGNDDTFILDISAVTDPGTANIDTIVDYEAGEIIDITGILSLTSGAAVSNYVRVTTTGLVQVNMDGSGTDWVILSNVNLLSGAQQYTVRYLLNGSPQTTALSRVAAPIALDLDGDGKISFIDTHAGATFDYGGGAAATAWVAGNDGLLVRDANHDGNVTANELVFATTGSDLEGLAVYDSDGDGQLSSADDHFADFAVWQDADSDGSVDEGELRSLSEESIASISLSSDGTGYNAAGGDVTVVGTGSFTRVDGSKGVLADAEFATSAMAGAQQARIKSEAAVQTAFAVAAAVSSFEVAPLAWKHLVSENLWDNDLDHRINVVPAELHSTFGGSTFETANASNSTHEAETIRHQLRDEFELEKAEIWDGSPADAERQVWPFEPAGDDRQEDGVLSFLSTMIQNPNHVALYLPVGAQLSDDSLKSPVHVSVHEFETLMTDAISPASIDALLDGIAGRHDNAPLPEILPLSGVMAMLEQQIEPSRDFNLVLVNAPGDDATQQALMG